jgi:hypothetical protein
MRAEPKKSYLVNAIVKQNGEITELKKIGSFDAGKKGRLSVWVIRSEAYDYLLVLIAQGHTEIDIYLSGPEAAELKQSIRSLKEVARSVRIVNP